MKAAKWTMGVLSVLAAVAASAAPDFYHDGSKINLAAIRGVTAWQSGITDANRGGPLAPLHPCYNWQTRTGGFLPGETSVWWAVELPGVYKVERFFFRFPGGTTENTTDFTVQTSLDGTDWTVRHTVTGNAAAWVYGTFAGGAVDARFIKLDVTGFQFASRGCILFGAGFYGPNNPEVNPDICVAQSTWAGGSATAYRYDTAAAVSGAVWMIDDSAGENNSWNGPTMGATSNDVVITLSQKYLVGCVAMTAYFDNRAPRDFDVLVSPTASGDGDWTRVLEIRDRPYTVGGVNAHYTEHDFQSVEARRVKFHILRNWGATTTRIAQLYVYPAARPRGTVVLIR